MSDTPASTVVEFPKKPAKTVSSHEKIWGKPVLGHGYTALPSILIQAQSRLGITPLQFNILAQLLDYWRDPARALPVEGGSCRPDRLQAQNDPDEYPSTGESGPGHPPVAPHGGWRLEL